MERRVWTVLMAGVALLTAAAVLWGLGQDPQVDDDRPLPDLPAETLDGVALDRAFFGDRTWLVAVWLPG